MAVITATVAISRVVGDADLVNLQRIWGIGIIALSLIPLVGYGGQISLCQLTFAVIGMVVVAHVGGHTPLAYLWAAYPFTLYALNSNTNDSLVAAMVVLSLLVISSAPGRKCRW